MICIPLDRPIPITTASTTHADQMALPYRIGSIESGDSADPQRAATVARCPKPANVAGAVSRWLPLSPARCVVGCMPRLPIPTQ